MGRDWRGVKFMATWTLPSQAPVIEKSVHDYVTSIFRAGPEGRHIEITPISEIAESTRGWDASFDDGVTVFYFQYKLPDFLATPKEKLKSEMRFRRHWGFDDAHGVFTFDLRKQAANAPKSQHQYLLDLANAGELAFYLSPLFSDFKQLKKGGSLMPGDKAWLAGHISMAHSEALWRHVAPHLSGLVCFPAHCEVSEPPESHKFIFNTDREVSLHSDPSVVKGVRTIVDVYDEVTEGWGGDAQIGYGNMDEYIQKLARVIGDGGQQHFLSLISSQADRVFQRLSFAEESRRSEIRIRFISQLVAIDRAMRKLIGVRGFVARRAKGW